jgi:hypothetical protein
VSKQQKIILPIPPKISKNDKVAIADAVIEYIKDKTANGENWKGKKFPKYSKEYIESLDFKIAGKSSGDVNLTLSGDMLAAMKLLDIKEKSIEIGYDKNTEENSRAEGNILGSYGGEPNPKKARDFLGIDPKVYAKIISENIGTDKDPKLMRWIEKHITK